MKALAVSLLCAAAVWAQAGEAEWKPLFDGKGLGQWRDTPFARSKPVKVDAGAIALAAGQPLTGVTWAGEFPKTGYELRFEAARFQGNDFFASVTFPAGGNHATWVLGGWGGDIVGISSIDGWDASDNETRNYVTFETGRWYSFRLQVTDERIQAWIDGERIVNVPIRGRAISMRRGEIELSIPLGFASYNTAGAVRKIEWRPVAER